MEINLNGEKYMIKLVDTAGQEDYDNVRQLFYKDADCILLCYDISNRVSFTNIMEKWLPDLLKIEKWPFPIVLVGKFISLYVHF